MRKLVVLIVGIVTFVWATVSAFSIFSELTFLVDGWTWSVDHGPIFIKNIALAVGKKVHEIVGGYREFVRGLVKMLHLPPLPSLVYDMVGILAFSIGRGYRLGTRGLKQDRLFLDVQKNAKNATLRGKCCSCSRSGKAPD